MRKKIKTNKKFKLIAIIVTLSCTVIALFFCLFTILFLTNRNATRSVYKFFTPKYNYTKSNCTETATYNSENFTFEYPENWLVDSEVFSPESKVYVVKSPDAKSSIYIYVADNPEYPTSFEKFLSEKTTKGVDSSYIITERFQTTVGEEEAWGIIADINIAHPGSPFSGSLTTKKVYVYHNGSFYQFEISGSKEELAQTKCTFDTILKSFEFN